MGQANPNESTNKNMAFNNKCLFLPYVSHILHSVTLTKIYAIP